MIKSALLASILLILSVTSFAKGDGVETNRISRLQYELHADGLPFDPDAVIQGYKQAFGLSDPEIQNDLERIMSNSTLTMYQRSNAFSCYLRLVDENQKTAASVLRDENQPLRHSCLLKLFRTMMPLEAALELSKKWMIERSASDFYAKDVDSIRSAWNSRYRYGNLADKDKQLVRDMFYGCLNDEIPIFVVVHADVFLHANDPEYTTSGLRAETIGKWMSRTNEAPVAFQERCSRYFLRAAKEANICPVSVPNPQTDAVEETNRTETNDLDHGNSPAPAETADATAPSTEADSREPHEKHPWWFVGLALVFGGFAWWRFLRKTKG